MCTDEILGSCSSKILLETAPETNQAENNIQLILKDFLTKILNKKLVLPPNGW